MKLPEIIQHKQFKEELTKEQQIFKKILENQKPNDSDEKILDELIGFYESTTKELEKLDLKNISSNDFNELKDFLRLFYNVIYPVQNKLNFKKLYRVCIVNDEIREKGKIRHPKYISFPDIDYNKKRGKLNRASTSESTLLYASSILNVAIAEVKPQKGDKIIISYWEKNNDNLFNSYPIINCTKDIANEFLKQSAEHFKQMYSLTHMKLATIIDINLQFLASEFIKPIENGSINGYEYAFSSYYSDKIIESNEFDCIIYPSVPFSYRADNLAIKPDNLNDFINIKKGLKLKYLKECEVKDIDYSRLSLDKDFYTFETIRETDWIEPDDIIWNN